MHKNGSPAYMWLTLEYSYIDHLKSAALDPMPMKMEQNDVC